jgi:hypothetical protein
VLWRLLEPRPNGTTGATHTSLKLAIMTGVTKPLQRYFHVFLQTYVTCHDRTSAWHFCPAYGCTALPFQRASKVLSIQPPCEVSRASSTSIANVCCYIHCLMVAIEYMQSTSSSCCLSLQSFQGVQDLDFVVPTIQYVSHLQPKHDKLLRNRGVRSTLLREAAPAQLLCPPQSSATGRPQFLPLAWPLSSGKHRRECRQRLPDVLPQGILPDAASVVRGPHEAQQLQVHVHSRCLCTHLRNLPTK